MADDTSDDADTDSGNTTAPDDPDPDPAPDRRACNRCGSTAPEKQFLIREWGVCGSCFALECQTTSADRGTCSRD